MPENPWYAAMTTEQREAFDRQSDIDFKRFLRLLREGTDGPPS